MSRKSVTYFLIFIQAFLTCSCVRDRIYPCPPLSVQIEVVDKNYFNVNDIDLVDKIPENMPFNSYIPALCYTLRDASTGEIVEESSLVRPEGRETDFSISFCCCIPHGKYVLTVWGSTGDIFPLDKEKRSLTIHPDGTESEDFYLATDTLVFDAWNHSYKIGMERITGKLLVIAKNLPDEVSEIRESVDGLFNNVSSDFTYGSPVAVKKNSFLSGDYAKPFVSGTLLAPSIVADKSRYSIRLFGEDGNELEGTAVPEVGIGIKRNTLTLLCYDFAAGGSSPVIYIYVDDRWEVIHGMEID